MVQFFQVASYHFYSFFVIQFTEVHFLFLLNFYCSLRPFGILYLNCKVQWWNLLLFDFLRLWQFRSLCVYFIFLAFLFWDWCCERKISKSALFLVFTSSLIWSFFMDVAHLFGIHCCFSIVFLLAARYFYITNLAGLSIWLHWPVQDTYRDVSLFVVGLKMLQFVPFF